MVKNNGLPFKCAPLHRKSARTGALHLPLKKNTVHFSDKLLWNYLFLHHLVVFVFALAKKTSPNRCENAPTKLLSMILEWFSIGVRRKCFSCQVECRKHNSHFYFKSFGRASQHALFQSPPDDIVEPVTH